MKHSEGEGESGDQVEWIVDDALLQQASTNDEDESGVREPIDLPVKKDMAKRAKTVLQKSIVALESGIRPGAAKGQSAAKGGEPTIPHGYVGIDQGDRCCILLAEMVRGIVKGSQTKNARHMRMLCSLAYEEALFLKKMFSAEDIKRDEMQRIADQIALAKRSLKTSVIPGKNLLRVMLGLEPLPPRNQSEAMFPNEAALDQASAQPKPQNKKEATRRDDGALGERAIAKALKKAYDKNDGSPCSFAPNDDPDSGLQLTMIETLILFTFCSEGIPLSIEISARGGNALSWDDIGSVLEIAAKDYYQLSKEKLIKIRTALKKFEAQGESDAKTQAAKKVAIAEHDESMKEEAAQQASDYASDPQKLAKKRYVKI
jgi:hypothetical protein